MRKKRKKESKFLAISHMEIKQIIIFAVTVLRHRCYNVPVLSSVSVVQHHHFEKQSYIKWLTNKAQTLLKHTYTHKYIPINRFQ